MCIRDRYDVGDRDHAYANAEGPIEQLLAENPSIEVVIDLHRDAVDKHMVREVNGVQMAPIMFFNGLSRTKALGDISVSYTHLDVYKRQGWGSARSSLT